MTRTLSIVVLLTASPVAVGQTAILKPDDFRHHVMRFNAMGPEDVVNAVPDTAAWDWMKANVPFFACPDREFETTYYYRWWALRKHLKKTPKGWVFTEFLKPVSHATEFNAISCALGHHVEEGRWIRDGQSVDQYLRFWLQSGPNGGLQKDYHKYSSWAAAAAYDRWLVNRDRPFITSLLDSLVLDYRTWEKERLLPSGLFWQYDVRDGMEDSVSGGRREKNARPTINSYMFGNARAVAAIARLAGNEALAKEFDAKAARLKELVHDKLWSEKLAFFVTALKGDTPADVRELAGYTPWYIGLPDGGAKYDSAWKELMDARGFFAPTARRSWSSGTLASGSPTPATTASGTARWAISRHRDAQARWRTSCTTTTTALVTRDDYFKLLSIYSNSQVGSCRRPSHFPDR
ncbi:MAG: hypothetical protein U0746_19120 [Gemmataceae bacterium]